MIRKLLYTGLIMVVVGSLAACATVRLTSSGEKARLLTVDEAANCEKLGRTVINIKPSLLSVPRPQAVIVKDLRILARNNAANMGGDTVAPVSGVSNGQQTFEVYKCVP